MTDTEPAVILCDAALEERARARAGELGIPAREDDVALYDAYTADEIFLSSTSLCMCGVSSINGVKIGDGKVQGPITRKLMDAYAAHVDFDFEAQYLARL